MPFNSTSTERERGMARRYKRAMALFDETARARVWSEGNGGDSLQSLFSSSSSDELADLVDSFYHEADGEEREMGSEKTVSPARCQWRESIESVLAELEGDSVARRIRVEAERAVRAVGPRGDAGKRRVIAWLRDKGFDAGLCRAKWKRSDGIPAGGNHVYIDVVDVRGTRYILETNFAAEFEIARPSDDYTALVGALQLTPVFVAKPSVVERVVGVMCAAMEESIGRSNMHLPPWRRKEYVQAKWLSFYEREKGGAGAGKGCAEESLKDRAALQGRGWHELTTSTSLQLNF